MSDTKDVLDPVCGMVIEETSAAAREDWQGRRYSFCSGHCAAKFRATPSRYIKPDQARERDSR